MTAIIGVLNKHAVAIAADSAVTIAGRKVMNSANKIFTLSKYHPVAIAIYGGAELLGTPWEIIIKEFRKEIGDMEYDTVSSYADRFFTFLAENNFFCVDDEIDFFLENAIWSYIIDLIESSNKDPHLIIRQLDGIRDDCPEKFLPDMNDTHVEYIQNLLSKRIGEINKLISDCGVSISEEDLINRLCKLYTRWLPSYTGLVFVGFGRQEQFPSICECKVGHVVKDKLARFEIDVTSISKKNSSVICPFAQTDVMATILTGVSPKVQAIFNKSVTTAFEKLLAAIVDVVKKDNVDLANRIKAVDMDIPQKVFNNLAEKSIKKEYTNPFVRSVSTLEKEDLADFAESLITLTSLKRKVSLDQETVGGPVDVMIISKGDGAIWKKRKHYFDKELNPQFFNNYYN